jgi:hypothetical protein
MSGAAVAEIEVGRRCRGFPRACRETVNANDELPGIYNSARGRVRSQYPDHWLPQVSHRPNAINSMGLVEYLESSLFFRAGLMIGERVLRSDGDLSIRSDLLGFIPSVAHDRLHDAVEDELERPVRLAPEQDLWSE